ncbi:hypothetical protein [Prescottella subtropica]|nr:hypothetical protein [Prescottella subtropica]
MSSNYWTGLMNLISGVITLTVTGLNTASAEGAGWSSYQSASGG